MHIRPAALDDTAFILDSWCSGLAGIFRHKVDSEKFKKEVREYVYPLIPKLPILIAHDDSGKLQGFIAPQMGSTPILHWCYVRREFRRNGNATALLAPFKAATQGRQIVSFWWTPDFKYLKGIEYKPLYLTSLPQKELK